ncbi:aldehyde-activating protein [Aureimonas ureilytica]|uniref:Aldehyde-activating protein n=1 Tax=Aureimonas ureilytica TaxID=401562 RepID=A0A175RTD9_9HYPH|nr:GFA family protein [Aureimonas ureilytica]KTR06777.1 aldehyde-activating protein [Aureimonas ureilytica]
MRHPDLPLEGGCRCGRIRLRLSAAPLATFACHCTGCQRMSSSAYSLSAMVPSDGFQILSGEPVRGGLKQGGIHHVFCPDCMSWLFTRWEGMDGLVNIRPTMLDETTWFAPFIETYTSEKLPFAQTGAQRSFPKFPDEAEFPVLLQAYAEAVSHG